MFFKAIKVQKMVYFFEFSWFYRVQSYVSSQTKFFLHNFGYFKNKHCQLSPPPVDMCFFVRCETLAHALTQLTFSRGTWTCKNPGACPDRICATCLKVGGELPVKCVRKIGLIFISSFYGQKSPKSSFFWRISDKGVTMYFFNKPSLCVIRKYVVVPQKFWGSELNCWAIVWKCVGGRIHFSSTLILLQVSQHL